MGTVERSLSRLRVLALLGAVACTHAPAAHEGSQNGLAAMDAWRAAVDPRADDALLEPMIRRYGTSFALFERLRGERRDRPPAIEELAAGLLLTADATMRAISARDAIDPGGVWQPTYINVADVPLPLAPLYALSAGVDARTAREHASECFEAMAASQRRTELRQPTSR